MGTEGRGYEDEPLAPRRVVRAGRGMGPEGPMYGGYGGWRPGYGLARRFPIETKPFFLTSEFFGTLLLIVAMAIGAASHEDFDSRLFWILTTAVVSAYLLSRGIAKSGTKSRAADPREHMFQGEGRHSD